MLNQDGDQDQDDIDKVEKLISQDGSRVTKEVKVKVYRVNVIKLKVVEFKKKNRNKKVRE